MYTLTEKVFKLSYKKICTQTPKKRYDIALKDA